MTATSPDQLADLKRAATRLAAVIDSALVAIVTADAEGTILEYNPAAERLFGVSEPRAVGASLDLDRARGAP